MDRSRWLVVIAVAGVAIVALSFVDGWIVHDREVRGEGYRQVRVVLDAWRPPATPVLSLGVVAAAIGAVAAVASLRRPRAVPHWLIPASSAAALGLIAASVVPVGQDGFISSVDLSPGWATGAGGLLAAAMLAVAVMGMPRGRPAILALAAVAGVALLVGAGGRWAGLQLLEGSGEHWADGSYTRAAADGRPAATLVIREGRFEIAGSWSGSWDGSGLTIAIADDPACPDARGAYHAHGEGPSGDDLRFVKLVDTCRDGARADDLEAGVWERNP